jgi:hypothetical protein
VSPLIGPEMRPASRMAFPPPGHTCRLPASPSRAQADLPPRLAVWPRHTASTGRFDARRTAVETAGGSSTACRSGKCDNRTPGALPPAACAAGGRRNRLEPSHPNPGLAGSRSPVWGNVLPCRG